MIAGLIIGSMLGGIITFAVMACIIVGADSEKTNKNKPKFKGLKEKVK